MSEIFTIQKTLDSGLCISCGICAGNCPKNCITLAENSRQCLPSINTTECIQCGRCYKVCPVNQIATYNGQDIEKYLLGDYVSILYAQAKDKELLHNSTSGGFVTQMVDSLLKNKEYSCAFLIQGYNYDSMIKTTKISVGEGTILDGTPKSRYLLVSHENTVKYIINNPNEKVIIVATGCATQGILNTIKLNKLNRENYLLMGLFCDKTMHYGVVDYFKNHPANKGRKLSNLYFRTKDAGGWPGNVRLEYTDGSVCDLPNTERMKLKDYFMPERCLYCIDKLNRNCDISVGDNYISANKDKFGANSVIIRTERGMSAWQICCDRFVYHTDSAEDIITSQGLINKNRNYLNACMKGLYPNNIKKADKEYKRALERIKVGLSENVCIEVSKDICKHYSLIRKLKNLIKKIIGRR